MRTHNTRGQNKPFPDPTMSKDGHEGPYAVAPAPAPPVRDLAEFRNAHPGASSRLVVKGQE